MTCDIWHMTCDTWHVTCGRGWHFLKKNLAPWAEKGFEDLKEKDQLLNQLINKWKNDVGVCRTASATPGLLSLEMVLVGRQVTGDSSSASRQDYKLSCEFRTCSKYSDGANCSNGWTVTILCYNILHSDFIVTPVIVCMLIICHICLVYMAGIYGWHIWHIWLAYIAGLKYTNLFVFFLPFHQEAMANFCRTQEGLAYTWLFNFQAFGQSKRATKQASNRESESCSSPEIKFWSLHIH